ARAQRAGVAAFAERGAHVRAGAVPTAADDAAAEQIVAAHVGAAREVAGIAHAAVVDGEPVAVGVEAVADLGGARRDVGVRVVAVPRALAEAVAVVVAGVAG